MLLFIGLDHDRRRPRRKLADVLGVLIKRAWIVRRDLLCHVESGEGFFWPGVGGEKLRWERGLLGGDLLGEGVSVIAFVELELRKHQVIIFILVDTGVGE